ncbi:MAG: hypothetical protein IKC09_01180 [Oscillospiraceae bacterium]|nr:hypothetical protein [Oscillospiraceae bacterium]
MKMRLGFAQGDMTPPVGIELGGYAGYRPNEGFHDPLHCKAVVLEQDGVRYALVTLDLLCVDEPLYLAAAAAVAELGITRQRLIVCAIHSHAAPLGVLPGEGILGELNCTDIRDRVRFREYMDRVVRILTETCRRAVEGLEPFRVAVGRGPVPPLGSERHTGASAGGSLTALRFRTDSGRELLLYSFPCHPTVLPPANLQCSGDFVGCIPKYLDGKMAVFCNGAAGDISTRFTRREATFAECDRMGQMAAQAIRACLKDRPLRAPEPLRGIQTGISLKLRGTDAPDVAEARLASATEVWEAAATAGEEPGKLRLLRSKVEGAWVNLEFARKLPPVEALTLPVTAFRFMGVNVVTIPGELYSTLLPDTETVAICYANGYDRYIGDRGAYDRGDYEALAAVLAPGEGETLCRRLKEILASI